MTEPLEFPLLQFNEACAMKASFEWGFNCGPAALAAVTGSSIDDVRRAFGPQWPGYTQAPMMREAAKRLGWRMKSTQGNDYVLARVQWGGPWLEPGVPWPVRLKYTHWIGMFRKRGDLWIFDINGCRWMPVAEWNADVVPKIVRDIKKADGTCELPDLFKLERIAR